MRTPKYSIGDIFYAAYTISESEVNSDISDFITVPSIAIITNISIDRKEITYTLKEYKKQNKGYEKHEIKYTESSKVFSIYSKSYTEKIDAATKTLQEAYIELTKEINKEKLSAVLHGE